MGSSAQGFVYSEAEVDGLIADLTAAAKEAIEQAAAEAAKAATMAVLGREAAALRREAAAAAEAERWKQENKASKRRGVRNAVVTGAICFVVGALAGGGAIFVILL